MDSGLTIDLSIVERNIRIRCPDHRLGAWVQGTCRAMETVLDHEDQVDLEIVIELSDDDGEYRIQRPHHVSVGSAEAGEFLALLEDVLVVELQLLRQDLFFVHAAVLGQEDGVVLIPAESGCGKSSLAWALARRGLEYYSDELAPIDVEGVRVLPFPRALRLKAAPPPPNTLPPSSIDTGGAYCIPAELLPGGLATVPAPISAVFFLRRPPTSSQPEIRELTTAQAVAGLVTNTLNLLAHSDYGVDHAARIVRSAPCFDLVAGDLETTCDLLQSTLAASRSPVGL